MRSETILSIRKARKKYYEELKSKTKVKFSPVLNNEKPKKNPLKEKGKSPEMFSNHIKSVKDILMKSACKISPIKPIKISNPFKKQFGQISNLVFLFNKRIEEFREKIFSFLVILFDAEELLIAQEAGTGHARVQGGILFNSYLQNIQMKGSDYVKTHIEKLSRHIIEMPNPLVRFVPGDLNFSRLQKYPKLVGLFVKNQCRSITSGMISFFYETEQRE